MDARVSRSRVAGECRAPPSKSYTHRAILAAGYADGATVRSPLVSSDTRATMRAVEALGGDVDRSGVGGNVDRSAVGGDDDSAADGDDDHLSIEGFDGRPGVPDDVVDCGNSGTTMRLVTACAALGDGLTVLTGDDSLRSRPQGPLLEAIEDLGGRADSTRANGQAPLVVGGAISGGRVAIPGDVSSQFVTALLMAGAVTEEGIDVDLETALKSAPYVDVTIEVLRDFGVDAEATDGGFSVGGGQSYRPAGGEYEVPGDFSSMSYLLAAGVVAGDAADPVVVRGARPSAQGDSAIVDVLQRMGGEVEWDRDGGVIEVRGGDLAGVEVGVADTPDLLPTIAAVGAVADGDTRITDCEHVRYKETDRVSAMAEELRKLGGSVTEHQDELVVHGDDSDLVGAAVDGRADHRIVMALTVAGLAADGTTTVRGAEHVDVSFPGFFDVMGGLGADVAVDGE